MPTLLVQSVRAVDGDAPPEDCVAAIAAIEQATIGLLDCVKLCAASPARALRSRDSGCDVPLRFSS
ncbi:hypothetical protein [Sandaracinus amylolyticus]|uniref:hypothetical protein n=1 Tax=Sandaracinus amylolyticus TaxID=927083 RepID=UPI001F2B92C5|nr:hypothetical protein [Sandaracinus amylolyticus]